MDQIDLVIDQKGPKMYEKRQNIPAQKPVAERGSTPPPLTEKIR